MTKDLYTYEYCVVPGKYVTGEPVWFLKSRTVSFTGNVGAWFTDCRYSDQQKAEAAAAELNARNRR